MEETAVANDGFLLAYVRPSISDAVLQALDGVDREAGVYGAADTEIRLVLPKARSVSLLGLCHPISCRIWPGVTGGRFGRTPADLRRCRFFKNHCSRFPNRSSTNSTSMPGTSNTTGSECSVALKS